MGGGYDISHDILHDIMKRGYDILESVSVGEGVWYSKVCFSSFDFKEWFGS